MESSAARRARLLLGELARLRASLLRLQGRQLQAASGCRCHPTPRLLVRLAPTLTSTTG